MNKLLNKPSICLCLRWLTWRHWNALHTIAAIQTWNWKSPSVHALVHCINRTCKPDWINILKLKCLIQSISNTATQITKRISVLDDNYDKQYLATSLRATCGNFSTRACSAIPLMRQLLLVDFLQMRMYTLQTTLSLALRGRNKWPLKYRGCTQKKNTHSAFPELCTRFAFFTKFWFQLILITPPPRTKWPPFRRRHFQMHSMLVRFTDAYICSTRGRLVNVVLQVAMPPKNISQNILCSSCRKS